MADPFEKTSHTLASAEVEHFERRCEARYGINADTEVEEPQTQAKVFGRTADLGMGGCYVDVVTTFAVGTIVCVRISRDGQKFEARAKVLYGRPGMGMGMAFLEMAQEERTRLEGWIRELSTGSITSEKQYDLVPIKEHKRTEGAVLGQLIKLLMRKGLLTQAEAEDFRRELDRNIETRED